LNQTYDKNKMEWIIIDDGTDKIEDLIVGVPGVKYFKYDNQLVLGKKRNLMHEKCSGDIIIYMDDDDYYPPTRVSHAVETLLANPQAMCAGSSEMHIYFKHIGKMIQFGPYGPNHSTAATFAFRKELLQTCRYDDNAALAEERDFLKNYTIPFVQLNITDSILVFSHIHNSFDKRILLDQPNKFMKDSTMCITDFIKNDYETNILQFFMTDIDELLEAYHPGKPEHKKEVLKQIDELTIRRMTEQQMRQLYEPRLQELLRDNAELKTKNTYLENKIKEVISNAIKERQNK
jgi:glycosyltransferase involved in cell wall biosynthesis